MGWVKLKHRRTADCKIHAIDPILERMDIEFRNRTVGCKLPHKYKSGVSVGDVVEIEHMGVLTGDGLRHPEP